MNLNYVDLLQVRCHRSSGLDWHGELTSRDEYGADKFERQLYCDTGGLLGI